MIQQATTGKPEQKRRLDRAPDKAASPRVGARAPSTRIPLPPPAATVQRALNATCPVSARDLLHLRQTISNRATGRLLAKTGMSPRAALQRSHFQGSEEGALRGVARPTMAAVAAASRSTGQRLPADLGRTFEQALGVDLSAIRVHADPQSADAGRAIGARAYTIGQDIHFNDGQYNPASSDGQLLLAHEVAHTVQQGQGSPTAHCKLEVSEPEDALEVEADRAAAAMLRGQAVSVSSVPGPAPIARKKEAPSPFQGSAGTADVRRAKQERRRRAPRPSAPVPTTHR